VSDPAMCRRRIYCFSGCVLEDALTHDKVKDLETKEEGEKNEGDLYTLARHFV